MLNLVANARDAMPGGGGVLVSTSGASSPPDGATDVPGRRWVLLEVQDGGVGMDAATLACAFDPFFTTKPDGRGTGLGLTSVWRANRAASGEVRIRSQPGNGTVVQAWLPECTAEVLGASGDPRI